MRYPRYPEYKDSGIEWLGEIPTHWMTRRLKYAAPDKGEKLSEKPVDVPYIGLEDIESGTGRLLLEDLAEEVESTVVEFKEGDILFGKLRPYLAKVVHIDFQGVGSTELLVLRPKSDVDGPFLAYELLSAGFIETVNGLTYGTKMPRANSDQVGGLRVGIPSLVEQRAIAAFLDRETARIDALVAKQERLIALLEEKRAALISHAVTRGLDPTVPMKDSGIAFPRQIPKHWSITKLKRWVATKITDGPHDTPEFVDEGVPFVSAEAVSDGRIDFASKRGYITPELHAHYTKKVSPRLNDVFMVKSGATTGKLAMVDVDFGFSVWSPLALIRADTEKIDYRFLFLALHADYVQNQIKRTWSAGTQPNISMAAIERLLVTAPPLDEQRTIAAYLDRETAHIDALIAKVEAMIERLEEYRTALISAAVTGKIDVRTIERPVQ
jgi:type I restriction enzyme S subunit